MPILIRKTIEPGSPVSETEHSYAIESHAYQLVRDELRQYVEGRILGRSFLVAGHRGSGKTTMVRRAVEDVEGYFSKDGLRRPLLIVLHGPDLLERPAAKKPKAGGKPDNAAAVKAKPKDTADPEEEEAPETPETADKKDGEKDDRYHFLDRVVSGLYFGAAHEFVRTFRRRAEALQAGDSQRRDLFELTGELQVQLDRQPDLDRLRDFWSRVQALDCGVLFPVPPDARGRGVLELVALFSAGRAMRTFSGKPSESRVRESVAERKRSVSLVTIEGQNLLPTVLGLASGALVWAGLDGTAQPLAKSFAALVTGLGAVLALKIASERRQEVKQTWKETFIPDNDAGSLYRVLPFLIERFQLAGLYPVFVVDELDKVPGLDGKINALLGYMKQFVTERAFFCFLTDRGFYQHAEAQTAGGEYSALYTRFGDGVYVQYRPQDVHKYLTEIITVQGTLTDEINASVLMRYVLLHRTHMHPYDLRREITRWTGPNGEVAIPITDILSRPTYNRDVLMQVAVECAYRHPSLAEFVSNPIDAQMALDALYYPSRMWRKGVRGFTLDKDSLREHLVERSGIREDNDGSKRKLDGKTIVPDELLDILFLRVQEVMDYLIDPTKLATQASSQGFLPAVVQLLQQVSALARIGQPPLPPAPLPAAPSARKPRRR